MNCVIVRIDVLPAKSSYIPRKMVRLLSAFDVRRYSPTRNNRLISLFRTRFNQYASKPDGPLSSLMLKNQETPSNDNI